MTFWTFAPKTLRWRIRGRHNLDFDNRRFGLEYHGRHNFLKELYLRLCRTPGTSRFAWIFVSYPFFIWYRQRPVDPEKAKNEERQAKEADDWIKNNVPVDPVLGNPTVSAEHIGNLISSNYGFMSMIDLITLDKKSSEFWEYQTFKIGTENDRERWGDYRD